MQIELSTWQPLCEFAAILFAFGLFGCWQSRSIESWWVSQGMILLSVFLGLAAGSAINADVDLFSSACWVPAVWTLTLWPARNGFRSIECQQGSSQDTKG